MIKVFDAFSGIGGFREGSSHGSLEQLEFESVGWCEIDDRCQDFYRDYFHAYDEFFCNDFNNLKNSSLPQFDMLFAGFPCQSFSNVGQRLGLSDPRGALFLELVRILNKMKPKYFILENVQKIATIDQGKLLDTMKSSLQDAGYAVSVLDLTASDYCLPQKRRRLFFCGEKMRNKNTKTLDIMVEKTPQNKWKYPTVWHLLQKEMPDKHIVPTQTGKTIFRKNDKWCGDLKINRPIARPITASMGKWHRANQDNYYSESYVKAKSVDLLTPLDINPVSELVRRITPLEALRIQGFPDSYWSSMDAAGYSPTVAYRLIGNAVPPPLVTKVIDAFILRKNQNG